MAVSSGSERHSEDGSEPVSSDIERFDEGIIPPPPDMTDDEEHDEDGSDMVGSDIEQSDEDAAPLDVAYHDEAPWDVGAFLAGAMPVPMGLACGHGAESTGALLVPFGMPSGAESIGALPSGSSTTLTDAAMKRTSDPGLTEADGIRVVVGAVTISVALGCWHEGQ